LNQWSDLDEILHVEISAYVVDCLINTLCSKVKDQGLYLCISYLTFAKSIQRLQFTMVPPTTQNKIFPLEIRSPLSPATSCSAWLHKFMSAQKKGEGVHWRALTLFFARTTLFSVMDGSYL